MFVSLPKLLVTALLIALAWYGFKMYARLRERRDALGKEKKAKAPVAQDLVKCPACDAYVAPRGTSNCGRADCPYPG